MIVKMDPPVSSRKRILVVDDRRTDSQLVKLYLERTNEYIVREENDPMMALTSAEEFHPDLIFLDVMMPGVDGGELAASFQSSETLKAVPVVFLTSAVTQDEVDAGRGLVGGRPYLAKPLVLVDMIACIERHLKTGAQAIPAKAV